MAFPRRLVCYTLFSVHSSFLQHQQARASIGWLLGLGGCVILQHLLLIRGIFRNVREVSEFLAAVQTVPDHEVIRDREQRLIRLEIHHTP